MSILGISNSYQQAAKGGMLNLSQLEQGRNLANKQMELAKEGQTASMAMTGAGMGAAAGIAAGAGGGLLTTGGAAGAMGLGLGTGGLAIAGLAAGFLLSKIF